MHRRAFRWTVAAVVLSAVPVAAVLAHQSRPTFRSAADVVRLHVIVQDAEGRPVRGLTKDDFTLLDAGKPRAIDLFDEVSTATTPRSPSLVPATFPIDVADNQSTRVSRLVVIVFDDMVIRPYLEKSKELAREAVHRLGDDAMLALLMTSGMDGVEATADRSAILRAIERVGTPASKAPRIPQRFGSQTSHATLAEKHLAMSLGLPGAANGCHFEALREAARMVLGSEAIRRAFVYVTPFCRADVFDDTAPQDPLGTRADLIESLRRADVALYGLDPRGQVAFSFDQFPSVDTGSTPVDLPRRTMQSSPVFGSQAALKELAKVTGGFAVTNSNDFEQGFVQLSHDLSDYYVLAFHSDDPKPNRYHPVAVTVNRPGVTVRARPGYMSGTAPPAREDKDPMVRLSASALPVPDLPLRLAAVLAPGTSRNRRVSLVLEVGWTGLERPDASGTWRESLDAMVLVAKVLSGKVERKWAVKRQVAMAIPARPEVGAAAYQALTQVDLPPGSYQIRLSAKSATTGKAGSVYLAVEIPNADAPLSLADILVGAVDRPVSPFASSPAGVTPLHIPVTLNRSFTASERIRLFSGITRKSSAPLRATTELIDATNRVVRTLDAAITPGDRAADVTVPLTGLAPGAYRARLTVTDGKSSASREVSVVVRP